MQELYNKLKKYSIDDAIKIEESDRQYIALKKLSENMTSPHTPGHSLLSKLNSPGPSPLEEREQEHNLYLSIILANAIICYQLSGKGEDYWEEFSDYYGKNTFLPLIGGGGPALAGEGVKDSLSTFIKQSKNNKRFIDTKIKRLEKLKPFLDNFIGNEECAYENMELMRDDLAKIMKQKKDAKTIVFAVKMFSYGARNIFNRIEYFPDEINIPIDSRLINLFEKYKGEYDNITEFYTNLSKKLDIPELHLDALVWVNYNDLIK